MKGEIYLAVGKQIRHYRQKKGITQQQLASSISFGEKSIGHFECGERAVSIETLAKISENLQVPISCFINNIGYSNKADNILSSDYTPDYHSLYELLNSDYKQVINSTLKELYRLQMLHTP